MRLIPKKLDYFLARNTPNLYTLLWTWHIVQNEPPYWLRPQVSRGKHRVPFSVLSRREWTVVGYGAAGGLFVLVAIIIALQS